MMTAYMGQLFLMSLYLTVTDTIPAPVNFTILSHNFKHILRWNPGINSPPQTVFNFEQRCENGKPTIQVNIRDTTVDVSETIQDIYTQCTFSLWASRDNMNSSTVTKSFTPYEDTIIGPPVIFLSGCVTCLNISISLPNESKTKSRKTTEKLKHFYNFVIFNISWKKNGQNVDNLDSTSERNHVLKNLQPGEQYCVSVRPQIFSNSNTRASSWQCEYTSKREPEGVFLMSWALGASLSGFGVLLLVACLVYTRFLCKPKTPESLKNIVPASYLNPESMSSPEVQLVIVCKSDPINNYPLNQQKDAKNKQHEDNEDYVYKADTEDEEEYNDDDDGSGNCIYMGCKTHNSSSESKNGKEKAIVSTLPPHDRSGVSCTAGAAIEQIHNNEPELKKQLKSEASEDIDGHLEVKNTPVEFEENEDSGDSLRNINLFSVTLRALKTEEDLDEEEVCKPLLAKSETSKDSEELSGSHISMLEKQTEECLPQSKETHRPICVPVQTEMKTHELLQAENQEDYFPVWPSTPDPRNEQDTASGYTVSKMGNIHEQDSSLSEDSDSDLDCDYITR